MSACPDCYGTGAFSYECRNCGGSGEYTKANGRVMGECYMCGGTGRFYPKFDQKKRTLAGLSFPFVIHPLPSGEDIFAYKCRTCRGRGNIRDTTAENLERAAI